MLRPIPVPRHARPAGGGLVVMLALTIGALLTGGAVAVIAEPSEQGTVHLSAAGPTGTTSTPPPSILPAPAAAPATAAVSTVPTRRVTTLPAAAPTTAPRPAAVQAPAPPAQPPPFRYEGRPIPTARTNLNPEPVRATNGRLGIELTYFVPGPPTETAIELTWSLRWNDAIGYASEIGFDFGDGRQVRRPVPYGCQNGRDQSTIAHPAGVATEVMSYRRSGQYPVTAWVVTSSCAGGDVRTEVAMPSPPIVAGADQSNGPDVGFISLGTNSRPGDDPAVWKVLIRAADRDGYVSRIDITWGDGTTDVVEYPLGECADQGSSWPSSDRQVEVQHRFATEDRNQHSVVVFSTSVGCDGSEARRLGGVSTLRSAIGPY